MGKKNTLEKYLKSVGRGEKLGVELGYFVDFNSDDFTEDDFDLPEIESVNRIDRLHYKLFDLIIKKRNHKLKIYQCSHWDLTTLCIFKIKKDPKILRQPHLYYNLDTYEHKNYSIGKQYGKEIFIVTYLPIGALLEKSTRAINNRGGFIYLINECGFDNPYAEKNVKYDLRISYN